MDKRAQNDEKELGGMKQEFRMSNILHISYSIEDTHRQGEARDRESERVGLETKILKLSKGGWSRVNK